MADPVFAALADPTRRHLYGRLASGGPFTATTLAADLSISRQAVAKHLGILANAGMASSAKVGRETRFAANLEPLGEVQQWIQSVEGDWQKRLAALSSSLDRT